MGDTTVGAAAERLISGGLQIEQVLGIVIVALCAAVIFLWRRLEAKELRHDAERQEWTRVWVSVLERLTMIAERLKS